MGNYMGRLVELACQGALHRSRQSRGDHKFDPHAQNGRPETLDCVGIASLMTSEVAVAALCNGVVERLPSGADSRDVLGCQGQVLHSRCAVYEDCKLSWCLSSSYLTSQVNALCSFLSGQLIRGDAILTASLSSSVEAQLWIDRVVKKSQALNAPGTVSKQKDDVSSSTLHNSNLIQPKQYSDNLGSQRPQSGSQSCIADCGTGRSAPSHTEPRVCDQASCSSSLGPEMKPTRSQNESSNHRTTTQKAYACTPGSNLDDVSEPRTRLLWSIAGQASSLDWRDRPPRGAAAEQKYNGSLKANLQLLREANPQQQKTGQGLLCKMPASPAPSNEECTEKAPSAWLTPFNANELSSSHDVRSQETLDGSDRPDSCWADMQPELLAIVARKCKKSAPVQCMVSTCRSWRQAILGDPQLLQCLEFGELTSSFSLLRQYKHGRAWPASVGLPITALLDKAAKAGNLGACVAIAGFSDNLGMKELGMKYRRRAAKLGDLRSQVAVGAAAYTGSLGVMRDSDEAHRWLSKAANRLIKLPFSLSTGQLLSQAALYLGFLSLDGEATKLDLEGAVSWFRLASKCGSREAETALGTLLRTGQYGPA